MLSRCCLVFFLHACTHPSAMGHMRGPHDCGKRMSRAYLFSSPAILRSQKGNIDRIWLHSLNPSWRIRRPPCSRHWIAPPWVLMTLANSLGSSSSLRMANNMWRGTMYIFACWVTEILLNSVVYDGRITSLWYVISCHFYGLRFHSFFYLPLFSPWFFKFLNKIVQHLSLYSTSPSPRFFLFP